MEAKDFAVKLSRSQMELLMETVEGFEDHQKLIHLTTLDGDVEDVPLPESMLNRLIHYLKETNIEDARTWTVALRPMEEGTTQVRIVDREAGAEWDYTVHDDDFQKE